MVCATQICNKKAFTAQGWEMKLIEGGYKKLRGGNVRKKRSAPLHGRHAR